MQRDTSSWHIARANELSLAIDNTTERPVILLREFYACVNWLARFAPQIDVIGSVRCPQHWD